MRDSRAKSGIFGEQMRDFWATSRILGEKMLDFQGQKWNFWKENA